MRNWRVHVDFRTAAGELVRWSYDVSRDTPAEAEDAAVREVLRQPGREIVGVETEEIKPEG